MIRVPLIFASSEVSIYLVLQIVVLKLEFQRERYLKVYCS